MAPDVIDFCLPEVVEDWETIPLSHWHSKPNSLIQEMFGRIPARGPDRERLTGEELFRELAGRWREETKTFSSSTDIALHTAYQDIIGMGERALPFIFREMSERGGHWFWALRHITHENPVPPEDAGKIYKMTEAWLRWGRDRLYL